MTNQWKVQEIKLAYRILCEIGKSPPGCRLPLNVQRSLTWPHFFVVPLLCYWDSHNIKKKGFYGNHPPLPRSILARSQATVRGLAMLSQSLKETGGVEAVSLRFAEQYIQAFSNIAKEYDNVASKVHREMTKRHQQWKVTGKRHR
ncbi:hypothetical protein F2Q69_00052636 [Brassica cretica]|uniref:STML2-like C-terminal extension domain-containing protein n=1 Tax=Brassica cretica TaxID=69181 RepID=A0A8S9MVN8_BRACR|nr:hypothetical protein F2Q69_00052636 [Brassica cretica]